MDELYVIQTLIEKYRKIVDSEKNVSRSKLWTPTPEVVKEKFRGKPKPWKKTGKIPMLSWPETKIWAEFFGYKLDDYYRNPLTYLKNILKARIYYFENIDDDNYMEDIIPIYLGEGFEPTFFGMEQRYSPFVEPWLESVPILINECDLEKLEKIDIFENGLMNQAKRFYEMISELLGKWGLRAGFPSWYHSPFHMTIFTHGLENTFIDMVENPELILKIMDYMTRSQIKWSKRRSEYIGLKHMPPALLANDYVSVPNISPAMYRDFILPFEKEISREMGGIAYWHDCGDATPYMEYVKEIPDIHMIHSGPFSNFEKVADIFRKVPIEVHLRPQEDYMLSDSAGMAVAIQNIMRIAEQYDVEAYTIRVSCYKQNGAGSVEDLEKIKLWSRVSQALSVSF